MDTSLTEIEVAVVGGGLAGLTTAAFAARAGASVCLLDARSDLGGRARTSVRDGCRHALVAFLVMLDRLSASERAAFILHDVFGVPFDEVATTLERETEACRSGPPEAPRET